MYFQITTRCNMTCEHCCFSCTNEGEDMSFETFKQSIKEHTDNNSCITIGGGEPTLHPQFDEILGYAIVMCENVCVITNGSHKVRSLRIADLINKGLISGGLSQDYYHDPIDKDIIKRFKNIDALWTVTDVKDKGRAAESGASTTDGCACESLILKPNGRVKWCGCDNAPYIDNNDKYIELSGKFTCYNDYLDMDKT